MSGTTGQRALFVAGAGTEIGKTYVTAALTRWLCEAGRPVRTLKPLASGVPPIDDAGFAQSDTAILLAAQGLPVTPETVEGCTPWRFAAPLAPDQAAAKEGRSLGLDELVAWCEAQMARERTVLIEGVGGLMSPITADATGLDWLKRLGCPALLVTGSYLGAISHALTAAETLRAHGVPLVAVVVSESPDAPTPPDIVAGALAARLRALVAVVPRRGAIPQGLADLI